MDVGIYKRILKNRTTALAEAHSKSKMRAASLIEEVMKKEILSEASSNWILKERLTQSLLNTCSS